MPIPTNCNQNKQKTKIFRLCINDTTSKLNFLIDTGADVSVLPPASQKKQIKPTDFKLYAANGTEITTYGSKTIDVDLGLRRNFQWNFLIADIQQTILE